MSVPSLKTDVVLAADVGKGEPQHFTIPLERHLCQRTSSQRGRPFEMASEWRASVGESVPLSEAPEDAAMALGLR